MNKFYLLSGKFDYKRLICNDAGPEIAEDYGLKTVYFSDCFIPSDDVFIVDPWIHDSELLALAEIIHRPVRCNFFNCNRSVFRSTQAIANGA